MNQQKVKRNSSVELLRILAMLFIVCSHCAVHGGLPSGDSTLSFNNALLDWCTLGNLGVDIFILISGYFLCNSANFSRTRNIIRLLTQVWFFSALGLAVYLITGHPLGGKILLDAVFPTLFSEYWFFTIYVVMMLFLPYVNMVLNKLDKKQFLELLAVMLVIWSVIPTFTLQRMGGNELLQFMMFYSVGAYFRRYPANLFSKRKFRYSLTAVSCLFLLSSSVVLRFVLHKDPLYFYSRQSVLTVGLAVGLFSIAIYRKSFTNRLINKIAGCTFGIYLFHDNPLMRGIIWQEWLPKTEFYHSYFLIVSILLSILIVMSVGTVIELIRQATIQKPVENLLTCAVTKVQNLLKKRSLPA